MAPWLSIFGDFTKDPEIMYNNFRVYGTGLLLLMGEYYDKDNNNLHFMEELSLLSRSSIFLTSHKIIIFFSSFFLLLFISSLLHFDFYDCVCPVDYNNIIINDWLLLCADDKFLNNFFFFFISSNNFLNGNNWNKWDTTIFNVNYNKKRLHRLRRCKVCQ